MPCKTRVSHSRKTRIWTTSILNTRRPKVKAHCALEAQFLELAITSLLSFKVYFVVVNYCRHNIFLCETFVVDLRIMGYVEYAIFRLRRCGDMSFWIVSDSSTVAIHNNMLHSGLRISLVTNEEPLILCIYIKKLFLFVGIYITKLIIIHHLTQQEEQICLNNICSYNISFENK